MTTSAALTRPLEESRLERGPKPDWYVAKTPPLRLRTRALEIPGVVLVENDIVAHRSTLHALREVGFTCGKRWTYPDVCSTITPDCTYKFRDYQLDGIRFIRTRRGSILGDAVGLGKSRQSAGAAIDAGLKPVLIVGRLMTRGSWCGPRGEPAKVFGIDVKPLASRTPSEQAFDAPSNWYFVHYDVLEAWLPYLLLRLRPRVVIGDEVHHLRGAHAKRSRAFRALCNLKSVELAVALSGTPVRNRVIDLWPVIDAVCPAAVGTRSSFGMRYADATNNGYGLEYNGSSNELELRARLGEILLRRTRLEVQDELPPITRSVIEVTLDDAARERYSEAARDVRRYLSQRGEALARGIHGEELVRLTLLFKILSAAKLDTTAHALEDLLADYDKIVVFTWFRESAVRLCEAATALKVSVFGPATGALEAGKRLELAHRFREHTGSRSVFIGTMDACGEAINDLVGANAVLMHDLWWEPDALVQAEGRVWRQGQCRSVQSTYVVARHTIDEKLIETLLRKAELKDAIGVAGDESSLVDKLGAARHTVSDADILRALVEDLTKLQDVAWHE